MIKMNDRILLFFGGAFTWGGVIIGFNYGNWILLPIGILLTILGFAMERE